MPVFVLTISHRHGEYTAVYANEQLAWNGLEDYVREWWGEVCDTPPPSKIHQEELINQYFKATQEILGREEYYSIEEKDMIEEET